MKTYSTKLIIILVFLVLSCSDENYKYADLKQNGMISILCNFDFIKINESFLKSTKDYLDLKAKIINAIDNKETLILVMKNEFMDSIFLLPGKYYIEIENNNIFSAAFEQPIFYGKSNIFEIKPQTYNRVEVLCKIANCAISIEYSDNVKNQFINYYCILSNQDTMLIYDKNEIRKAYFTLKPINIKANLTYVENGTEKIKVIESKISSPEAGKHYKLFINANLNNTLTGLSLIFDSTLVNENIYVSDSINLSPYYGKILITEIMYDPDSIDDSKGEWFEIYNISEDVINLKNLVLRTGTRFHQIKNDLYIGPKSYLLFEKSELATPYSGYTYGSSLTFNNTGYVKFEIATYGSNGLDGDIIASIHYGTGTLMPKATGVSLNLSIDCYNIENLLNPDCWCISDSLYDGINKGTPSFKNKTCR